MLFKCLYRYTPVCLVVCSSVCLSTYLPTHPRINICVKPLCMLLSSHIYTHLQTKQPPVNAIEHRFHKLAHTNWQNRSKGQTDDITQNKNTSECFVQKRLTKPTHFLVVCFVQFYPQRTYSCNKVSTAWRNKYAFRMTEGFMFLALCYRKKQKNRNNRRVWVSE